MSTRIFKSDPVKIEPFVPSDTNGAGAVAAILCSLIALALTGCNSKDPAKAARAATAREDEVACQPAGTESLEPVCRVDRAIDDRGLVLTLHHPDGSFRRLLVTHDGRGVVAADGAEPARVKLADTIGSGSEIEVSLAGNRYILPATIKQ